MSISKSLIDKFAKIINSATKEPEKEQYFYGEVVMDGDVKCVKLDGSTIYTPCVEAADSLPGIGTNKGDRVVVLIKDHTATIIGNASNPALARNLANQAQETANNAKRTATDYIRQDPENGSLEIGNANSGSKNVLSSEGQRIYRKNEDKDKYELLAEFLDNKITLNDAEISKNQDENTLWFRNTDGSVGIDLDISEKNSETGEITSRRRSQIFLDATGENVGHTPFAKILVIDENDTYGRSSYINVLNNSITLQNGGSGLSGYVELSNTKLTISLAELLGSETKLEVTKNGVKINNANVHTDSSPLFKSGSVNVTCDNSTITYTGASDVMVSNPIVPAYGGVSYVITPTIDSGYTIVGLPRITTNLTNAFQLTSYGIADNKIYVWYHNAGSGQATNTILKVDWFAVKNSNLNV